MSYWGDRSTPHGKRMAWSQDRGKARRRIYELFDLLPSIAWPEWLEQARAPISVGCSDPTTKTIGVADRDLGSLELDPTSGSRIPLQGLAWLRRKIAALEVSSG